MPSCSSSQTNMSYQRCVHRFLYHSSKRSYLSHTFVSGPVDNEFRHEGEGGTHYICPAGAKSVIFDREWQYEFKRLLDQVSAVGIMLFIVVFVLLGVLLMLDALEMFINRLTN